MLLGIGCCSRLTVLVLFVDDERGMLLLAGMLATVRIVINRCFFFGFPAFVIRKQGSDCISQTETEEDDVVVPLACCFLILRGIPG